MGSCEKIIPFPGPKNKKPVNFVAARINRYEEKIWQIEKDAANWGEIREAFDQECASLFSSLGFEIGIIRKDLRRFRKFCRSKTRILPVPFSAA